MVHLIYSKRKPTHGLPSRSQKAGRFEKLLVFARSHSIVTRGSVIFWCATTPHPSCFFQISTVIWIVLKIQINCKIQRALRRKMPRRPSEKKLNSCFRMIRCETRVFSKSTVWMNFYIWAQGCRFGQKVS